MRGGGITGQLPTMKRYASATLCCAAAVAPNAREAVEDDKVMIKTEADQLLRPGR